MTGPLLSVPWVQKTLSVPYNQHNWGLCGNIIMQVRYTAYKELYIILPQSNGGQRRGWPQPSSGDNATKTQSNQQKAELPKKFIGWCPHSNQSFGVVGPRTSRGSCHSPLLNRPHCQYWGVHRERRCESVTVSIKQSLDLINVSVSLCYRTLTGPSSSKVSCLQ